MNFSMRYSIVIPARIFPTLPLQLRRIRGYGHLTSAFENMHTVTALPRAAGIKHSAQLNARHTTRVGTKHVFERCI